MSTKYTPTFDDYTKGHYIKKITNKHSKKQWNITEQALRSIAENIDTFIERTDQAETIHENEGDRICKLYFKIAGTKDSYKKSCCRSIVYVDSDKKEVVFLLVYHKSFLTGRGSETDKWQRKIKENFPQFNFVENSGQQVKGDGKTRLATNY